MTRISPLLFSIFIFGLIAPIHAADLTVKQLKNSQYFIPGWEDPDQGEWVQLKDGEYSRSSPPEEQLFVKVMAVALGSLTKQPTQDAAVVYGFSTGGTGFFLHLCAVLNDHGSPKHLAPLGLGDRVKINSLKISEGKIVLDMLVHGPGDPAPRPTVKKIATYILTGDKLVEQ